MASKNLLFEPHAIQHPIMRFPFRDMKHLHMNQNKQHLIVVCSTVVEMKAHNIIEPYVFREINNPNSKGNFFLQTYILSFVIMHASFYNITLACYCAFVFLFSFVCVCVFFCLSATNMFFLFASVFVFILPEKTDFFLFVL